MQLNDFYMLCDGDHREFFSVLIADWQDAGFVCEGDEEGMQLGIQSVRAHALVPCFSLRAGGADVAMIRLDIPIWHTYLGYEYTSEVMRELMQIEGLKHQHRMDIFYIENPGHALSQVQKTLRNKMHGFALELGKKIAP